VAEERRDQRPEAAQEDERGVYIISVVAELLGMHPQTLRIYERKGLLQPARTAGNTRRYSERDLARLRTIQRLSQDEGVNLAGVRMIVEMQNRLEELRGQMEELRLRLEHLFEYRFHGTVADYTLSFSTDPARFHFTIHVNDDEMPEVSVPDLQREVAEAARSWDDALSDALAETVGQMRGHELARRYAALFPEYYKSASDVDTARFDVEQFELLGPERPYVVALQNERGSAEPLTRVKLYKTGGKAALTELFEALKTDETPIIVENIVNRIDEVVIHLWTFGQDGKVIALRRVLDTAANIAADTSPSP